MRKLKYTLKCGNKVIGRYKVLFEKNTYLNNGNLYLGLVYRKWWRWHSFCDVTVNLNWSLPADTAYVDINNMPDMLDWLVENNLAEKLDETCQSGFVTYPKVRFNMDKVEKYCFEDNSTED